MLLKSKNVLYLFSFLLMIGAASQNSYGQNIGYEKGEILIQLKSQIDPIAFIRDFEEKNNLPIKGLTTLSDVVHIYLVELHDKNENLNKVINLFYESDVIINAQKNHFITTRETIPTDTLFNQQWFHKNTGQTGGTVDADIDTPDAWDITTGGLTTHNDTIVVCIIEGSGVDISHIDLIDNIWVNHAEIPNDGLDNDNNGYIDDYQGWNVATLDDAVGSGSHGTRVAGMVGASGDNITGVSGVNWDVKMMIIKGQVASNEASVIAAYNYPLVMRKMYNESFGQEGAFVVVTNASWGIDNGQAADAPLWCAMYDTLGTYGILNVAATTNGNNNVDLVGDLPTTCPSEYLIGVTMTNSQDIRAGSGYGPINIDIAAPGSSVLLPVPGNLYTSTNGTSFASPCVAGAIALAYSSPCPEFINYAKFDPAGAAIDMRNYILSSVDVISVLAGEVSTSGRLNVKNAIDSILSNCTLGACTPPYNLRDNYITDTTANFYWDGFSTDYLFYIQEGGNTPLEIALTNQDTMAFDTLIPCTNYSIWVKGICGLDTSAASFSYNFTTDGCCNNPILDLAYASEDTIIVSWDSILYATEYDIRYRKEGDVAWLLTLTDTISPVIFGGLDICSNYEFQIKTICFDSTHDYSTTYTLSTKGCGSCYEASYCDVLGAIANSEWIERIQIGNSESHTGANNGWYQSDTIIHGFIPGQIYNTIVTAGYSGFNFAERYNLWVDFDQSGTFDSNEKLIDDISSTDSVITTISVPITATLGVTKMRVAIDATNEPAACPTINFFGEYEDYCVYIGADAGLSEKSNSFVLFPNPAKSTVSIISIQTVNQVRILSLDGKTVFFERNPKLTINVSAFESGIYLVEIESQTGTAVQKLIIQ